MFVNDKMVLQLVALLKKFQIKKIVVSPGSRHNKLINSLQADNYFKLYLVVDERSAAFFALGLIQESGEPVAVTCSSGTACMNYGSAIVEAFYQRLPLLVLSSDRVPELLNQCEDQMYDQASTFINCTKYHCLLPVIDTPRDEWYCNRIINEALIELNHHGRGPVHINIPFAAHHGANYDVESLPDARKITLHQLPMSSSEWKTISARLKGKKVMVVWGQAVYPLNEVEKAENTFAEKYNVAVLTDKMSNCHAKNAIINTTITMSIMKDNQAPALQPDVVISIGANYIFNNELKKYLKNGKAEHWQVGYEDKVCDPFHTLTDIFEMPETYFFNMLSENCESKTNGSYFAEWKAIADIPTLPQMQYCELYAITKLMSQLPANCDLQLANSQTIRMAHYIPIKESIRVNCNRGVNGIDGSMSTAVGFGADSNKPLFYITGELSFFYDMNSLGNRDIKPNLRIIVINNGLGQEFKNVSFPGSLVLGDDIDKFTAAKGHFACQSKTLVKDYAENLGFEYLTASNKEEFAEVYKRFISKELTERPMLFEIFTDTKDETQANYSITSIELKSKFVRKVHDTLMKPELVAVKNLAKKIVK